MFQSATAARTNDGAYPKIKLIDTGGDGDTFTLGDRSSDTYLRVYDKEKESGDEVYKDCWRIELELKSSRAQATAVLLLNVQRVPETIMGLLTSHLHSHGLYPPLPSGYVPARIPAIRREKDDDKSLRWLDTQVKSTIARLIDAGRIEEVYCALGLKANGAYGWQKFE